MLRSKVCFGLLMGPEGPYSGIIVPFDGAMSPFRGMKGPFGGIKGLQKIGWALPRVVPHRCENPV